jgi:hypothetical protein
VSKDERAAVVPKHPIASWSLAIGLGLPTLDGLHERTGLFV